MDATPAADIVVGIDGSADSDNALRWAVEAAALRASSVRVLCAVWPGHMPGPLNTAVDEQAVFASVEAVLSHGRACAEARGVRVSTEMLTQDPVTALLDCAEDALMVVVGSRGRTFFAELLVGSVSARLARRARCPVVVVREAAGVAQDRVVVGVSGSVNNPRALAFAFDSASRAKAPLTALYGWAEPAPGPVSAGAPSMLRIGNHVERGERFLDEALTGWSLRYPEVELTREAVPVGPARALCDASLSASLVVVGATGAHTVTGSVSRAVLRRARCTVAIVP